MPIRDFAPGESPLASDFNRYFMQQHFVRKLSDESVTSSTTIQDDDHLFFTPIVNTNYWITLFGIYEADAASDLKISWSIPSGSTFDYVSDAIGSAATTSAVFDVSRSAQIAPAGGTPSPGGIGAGKWATFLVRGVFKMGPNAGTFRFRWAQSTSGAVATILHANSCLIARRLTT